MKVMQINTVYKQGSTGNIVSNIHTLLKKDSSIESFVAYGRGEWNETGVLKIGSKIDMYLHALGTRIFDKHGLYSMQATKSFIQEIDKLDIDIFHLHNIHGYYLNYQLLFEYLKEKKKPVIWTLHDCWTYTGHCAYYDYAACSKWQTECIKCPQQKEYPASYIFDNSNNNFHIKQSFFTSILDNLILVTPSLWLATEVKKSFLKEAQVKVINNGIDLTVFRSTKSNFRSKHNISEKFLILGVANVWEERKGLRYFIELAKMLKSDELIVLVGLNKKQLLELPDNIIGLTKTNSLEELVALYNSADVFVNPTLEDNFPTTNLESLACGTPVVTFDSGGSAETIDEMSGVVVQKGNIEELYNSVIKIKNNGKLFYTQYCIARAHKFFNKDERFEEYIKLYKMQ